MEPLEGKMAGASEPENVSTKRRRIAELAKQSPEMSFTSLAHVIDVEWLREAYRRTRKDGAVGVDGQTAEEYAKELDANLADLLERAKSGNYVAPPVRRVHIPKAGSTTETRPIGIPTFEDKVLQRGVSMILESVYEQDFYDFSYGFRPGRGAHQALTYMRDRLMDTGGGWVVELDIRKFFDTLDHAHLREIVRQRVCDGVLMRLIGKWLNAGVMEDGSVSQPEAGSPQGGVISPILANVYLHEVLDKWFEKEVRPRLEGAAFLVRYADDAVLGFTSEKDARRVLAVLPKRFGRYGLKLHPEKTRLVPFKKPRTGAARLEDTEPGTFDMLGFTHYWARSRKKNWVIKQKTAKGRLTRAIKAITDWCRGNRHQPIRKQHETLTRKLRGHYEYYGITGNSKALSRFAREVTRAWKKWLGRRSQRAHKGWDWMNKLLQRLPLPPPIAVHSVLRTTANPSR